MDYSEIEKRVDYQSTLFTKASATILQLMAKNQPRLVSSC